LVWRVLYLAPLPAEAWRAAAATHACHQASKRNSKDFFAFRQITGKSAAIQAIEKLPGR
jgi:hypothetical protein